MPTTDVSVSNSSTWSITINTSTITPGTVTNVSVLTNVLYYMLEVILALLAICGNSVILLAYICNRRLRIVPHYHLISLAISDLLMGAVAIPIWIAALQGFPYRYTSCLFALSMILFVDLASVFSLFLMTVDRYIFICFPLWYEVMITSKRTIVLIVISWFLSVIFVLPMPLTWNLGSPSQTRCYFMSIVAVKYLVFLFFACIIPPIACMTIMYLHILAVVRKQKRREKAIYSIGQRLHSVRSNSTSDSTGDKCLQNPEQQLHMRPPDSELRIALMFLFLLIFFVVTWVPMFFLDTLLYFGFTFSSTAVNYTVLLSHCNSSFNPLLYRFQNDFRHIFVMWICNCCRRRGRNGQPSIKTTS